MNEVREAFWIAGQRNKIPEIDCSRGACVTEFRKEARILILNNAINGIDYCVHDFLRPSPDDGLLCATVSKHRSEA